MPTSPPENELVTALVHLKTMNPLMGITKIHALLLKEYPDWVVSEKRTKKILQHEGLTSSSHPINHPVVTVYPTSRLIAHLDIDKWTPKVRIKLFGDRKGKGLVATADIQEGELIWKEDPFIVAPEWEIYDLQATSRACALCTTPFSDSPLIISCPASSSSTFCPARFCNRLCLARSAKVHPLLCPAQNPACVSLIKWARDRRWLALNALAHCMSRISLANQYDDITLRSDWEVMRSFAALGMEERARYSFKMAGKAEPDRTAWKKAHQLCIQAFKEPKTTVEQKKLAKILKKPLPEDIDKDLFEYEPGFLRNLGRMSLNLESHGGLYTLHSHLNHSCSPNVSVWHTDKRTVLSRISVVAKRAIVPGEELTVTYVNPELPYRSRQEELMAWGFGACTCERCVQEEQIFKLKGLIEDGDPEMHDLARELKAGLGVL